MAVGVLGPECQCHLIETMYTEQSNGMCHCGTPPALLQLDLIKAVCEANRDLNPPPLDEAVMRLALQVQACQALKDWARGEHAAEGESVGLTQG